MKLYILFFFLLISCGDGHHLDKNKAGFYLTAAAIKFDSYKAIAPQTFELKLSSNAYTQGDSSIISYEWEIIDVISPPEIDSCALTSGTYTGSFPRKRIGPTLTISDLGGSDDVYIKHTVTDNFGNSVSSTFLVGMFLLSPVCDAMSPIGGIDQYISVTFNGNFSYDKNQLEFIPNSTLRSSGPSAPFPDNTAIPEILHDIEKSGSYQSEGTSLKITRTISSNGTYKGLFAWGNTSGTDFFSSSFPIYGEYVLSVNQ